MTNTKIKNLFPEFDLHIIYFSGINHQDAIINNVRNTVVYSFSKILKDTTYISKNGRYEGESLSYFKPKDYDYIKRLGYL
jgi:hypothetical protein